ncbi:uncharacterized protein si:dkey-12l12.1 [Electrophorus electricus]|uniref:uncharacterized protein si:dkey-12l12.1 n=1 Tax=Electrophorus electricus TaxID=8005 RepID=UPI0015D08FA5|nr:uncharacterized protein si:dkey-12l12.1 [Electrophorus electricus]
MSTVLWVCLLCLQGCLLTHALNCTNGGGNCVPGQLSSVKLRVRRHTEPERERAHLSQTNQPGVFSAKGFPNTLIQADRSRRHLNSNKKKQAPRKSRFGTYSLLSHNPATPLQVVQPRMHSRDAGTAHVSPLQAVKQRNRRSVTRKKKGTEAVICS